MESRARDRVLARGNPSIRRAISIMSSEEYTSEEVEDGGAADFAGSLQTSLCWDMGNKQLGLKLMQNVENGRKVAFKWKVRPHMTFPCGMRPACSSCHASPYGLFPRAWLNSSKAYRTVVSSIMPLPPPYYRVS